MAIYTQLNQQDIQSLADNYDLKIVDFSPLDGGNGNSSYILKTQQASYVLTVCDEKGCCCCLKRTTCLVIV